jgi:hypothetical protein
MLWQIKSHFICYRLIKKQNKKCCDRSSLTLSASFTATLPWWWSKTSRNGNAVVDNWYCRGMCSAPFPDLFQCSNSVRRRRWRLHRVVIMREEEKAAAGRPDPRHAGKRSAPGLGGIHGFAHPRKLPPHVPTKQGQPHQLARCLYKNTRGTQLRSSSHRTPSHWATAFPAASHYQLVYCHHSKPTFFVLI